MNALVQSLWTHGYAALVFGPMLAGVVVTILPPGRLVAGSAVAVSSATAVMAIGVLAGVLAGAPVASVDALGAAAIAIVAVTAATAFAVFATLATADYPRRLQPFALGLGLVVTGAAFGTALEHDVLRMVVLAQAIGLAGAALTGLSALRDRRAATAGFGGVIVALAGGAIALAGAALVHAAGGDFDIRDITGRLAAPGGDRGVWLGAAFLLAGLATLSGLAPMHTESADRAARTGHGAAAIVIVVARFATFVALIRIFALTQSIVMTGVAQAFAFAVAGFGVVSVVAGALNAIASTDARRLAAHALTAQFGCALIGLAAGEIDGAIAALFVIAAGAMAVLAIVVGALAGRTTVRAAAPMAMLDGLGQTRPLVAASIMVAALGLTGAPLTAAFLGKWLSIEAALARGWYWAAAAIVASSFAAVFIAGQVVERLYFRKRPAAFGAPMPGTLFLAPALGASVLATLLFGWTASAPLDAARMAAGSLVTAAHAP